MNEDDGPGDNGYGMAYMLAHIKRNAEEEALAAARPRQELQLYLSDSLRQSGTDVLKWWAVSLSRLLFKFLVLDHAR